MGALPQHNIPLATTRLEDRKLLPEAKRLPTESICSKLFIAPMQRELMKQRDGCDSMRGEGVYNNHNHNNNKR
jgi:hypothetical protein